jgi:glycerol-3-phosphate dehydrogenase (NAD(P)+)
MSRIAVLGTTAWGTMLAILAARRGHDVFLWARSEAEASTLRNAGQNTRLLPGAPFPDGLSVEHSPEQAFAGADTIIVAVPSVRMRDNLASVADAIPGTANVVCATKGIEIESGLRMTQVIAEELSAVDSASVGVLSGPNLAPEIAAGKVSSATVAFATAEKAAAVQGQMNSEVFRIYTSDDVTGVELGGALKNIIAIGAGIIDGLELGDNAKAAFVTRGLHEITRLGVAMGARMETFAGLAGMGDLIASCYSDLGRNHRVGMGLASGQKLERVLLDLGQNAEGVPTTEAAVRRARQLGVEMPIAEMTRRVLFEDLHPARALEELMRRPVQPETRL